MLKSTRPTRKNEDGEMKAQSSCEAQNLMEKKENKQDLLDYQGQQYDENDGPLNINISVKSTYQPYGENASAKSMPNGHRPKTNNQLRCELFMPDAEKSGDRKHAKIRFKSI